MSEIESVYRINGVYFDDRQENGQCIIYSGEFDD